MGIGNASFISSRWHFETFGQARLPLVLAFSDGKVFHFTGNAIYQALETYPEF